MRKVNYVTGIPEKTVPLAGKYFAEGLTVLQDKVYLLTWQEKTGFVWDAFIESPTRYIISTGAPIYCVASRQYIGRVYIYLGASGL